MEGEWRRREAGGQGLVDLQTVLFWGLVAATPWVPLLRPSNFAPPLVFPTPLLSPSPHGQRGKPIAGKSTVTQTQNFVWTSVIAWAFP